MAEQHIYLDSNANPGGDGSIGLPYDSFGDINWTTGDPKSIFDWVAGGHDVFINNKRGSSFVTIFTFGGADFSGISGHPITVQDYGDGELPIFTHPAASLMRMDGNDYFTIKNIILDGQGTAGVGIYTPGSGDPSHNLILDNVTVQNYDGWGGFLESDNILVQNSNFNNNTGGGLGLHNSASPVVQDSIFFENGESGIDNIDGLAVMNGCSNFQILRNKSYNNKSDGGSGIDASAEIGLNITGVVEWNETYGNEGKGLSCSGNDKAVDEVTFVSNISYDNGTYNFVVYEKITAYVYHNWFGSSDNQSVQFGLSIAAEADDVICTFKNNIVHGVYNHAVEIKHPAQVVLTSDYNIMTDGIVSFSEYGAGVAKTFAEWQTVTSGDGNSLNSDPLLTSSGKIYATSPAKDSGVTITDINDGGELDLWGNATEIPVNIGAYQAQGLGRNTFSIGKQRVSFLQGVVSIG